MLGFLDFNFSESTLLISLGAALAGVGALLSGWAALRRARQQGRRECACAKEADG